MSSLALNRVFHRGRTLHVEALPDDFIVYKTVEDGGYTLIQRGGIPAKEAETNCCMARPLKYFPDFPSKTRWWLICAACKHAIKANGGTV